MRGGGGSLRYIRGIGVGERGGVCVGGMRGCRGEWGRGRRGGRWSGAEVMVERG